MKKMLKFLLFANHQILAIILTLIQLFFIKELGFKIITLFFVGGYIFYLFKFYKKIERNLNFSYKNLNFKNLNLFQIIREIPLFFIYFPSLVSFTMIFFSWWNILPLLFIIINNNFYEDFLYDEEEVLKIFSYQKKEEFLNEKIFEKIIDEEKIEIASSEDGEARLKLFLSLLEEGKLGRRVFFLKKENENFEVKKILKIWLQNNWKNFLLSFEEEWEKEKEALARAQRKEEKIKSIIKKIEDGEIEI